MSASHGSGMTRRQALRLLGMGTAAAYVAACAPIVVPSSETASSSESSSAPPVVEDVNGLKAADFQAANLDWQQFRGVNLNILMLSSPPPTDLWKDSVKIFEALSGATVTVTELPQNELNDRRFADLVAGGGSFDLINTEFSLIPSYAKSNFIEPLDAYMTRTEVSDTAWLNLDDVYLGVLNAGKFEDMQYALPATSESTILSYRKDIISKAPDTFDDLMAMAEAANKPGEIAGFVGRAQRGEGMNVYIWAGFLHGFGGNFFADFPNDMTPVINSAEAIAAAQFYSDLLNKFGPLGVASYTNEEVHLDAQTGKTASLIEWSGHPILIDNPELSQTSGKWGFTQVPQGPGGRWPAVFSWTWALNAGSQQKDAAWGLLQALVSPAAQLHNSAGLIVPTRKSVAESSAYIEASRKSIIGFDDWAPVNGEALAIANPDYRPRFPEWREVGDRVGIALQSVIAGEQGAQDAFDAAQTEIASLMKEKGYI